MKFAKTSLKAMFAVAGMVVASSSFAYSIAGGGTTTDYTGGTYASYGGLSLPCSVDFHLTLNSGGSTAEVDSVTINGSSACSAVTVNVAGSNHDSSQPYSSWHVSTAVSIGGTQYSVTISNVWIKIPYLNNVVCTGTVSGTMDNSNGSFTFTSNLSASNGGQCAVGSNPSLSSSPKVTAP
ncbi:MAG: hypothetical protein J0I77_00345 [Rudaea sp.]|uniref:hypothetical protein n=1 Tax=unclassified Rudaea TaxID=2627037 RepID=UPI0010F9252C|nr:MULTISPECIES: hypothetical protein [unclassified Rudaea]MBN8884142.1 hypothetical protein [Rudaea sp.]